MEVEEENKEKKAEDEKRTRQIMPDLSKLNIHSDLEYSLDGGSC